MTEKVAIWGAGGHGAVVADIVQLEGRYALAGFLDDGESGRAGGRYLGLPILGGRTHLPRLAAQGVRYILWGFGDNAARLQLSELVAEHGLCLAVAIHPQATVARSAEVGPGTVIAAGAVVNPAAVIGASVIVNTCASVDHHCIVEDGAHIAPGVHLASHVVVGRGAWVGVGASVRERVRIGAKSIIGVGAAVVADIPAGVVAYGVPATVINPAKDDLR